MVSDIALFFEPVSEEVSSLHDKGSLGEKIQTFTKGVEFPEVTPGSVAIFGVSESRRAAQEFGSLNGLTSVRKSFYQLKNHFSNIDVFDLGNITQGETVEDTYYAISNSVAAIIKQGGIAVILGGSQDLTYANYLAYEKLEQVVNLACVDSRFDLGEANADVEADRYLQKIILHQPNILFNFSNLAFQTHHIIPDELDLMKNMYFDALRLGEVQSDLEEVEPVVRSADMVSFDLSSIRTSDFPENFRKEPNGLYGEQACAIARYAGLSDKLSSFGLYNGLLDKGDSQSVELVAQLVWYFISGVDSRKKDYPFADKNEYTKYTVTLEDGQYDVVFYKSSRSDRWWMEVPYPSKRGAKYQRHFMVPCSYNDYLLAGQGEVPNRWWQTFQKLG
ncbi:MAG: formimidoylglutamase [Flavobacteriales bacterium]